MFTCQFVQFLHSSTPSLATHVMRTPSTHTHPSALTLERSHAHLAETLCKPSRSHTGTGERYGFLSENSGFSEALENQGVKFLGPKKLAIEVMGDKKNSKDKAEAAGVNVIPGCETPSRFTLEGPKGVCSFEVVFGCGVFERQRLRGVGRVAAV